MSDPPGYHRQAIRIANSEPLREQRRSGGPACRSRRPRAQPEGCSLDLPRDAMIVFNGLSAR